MTEDDVAPRVRALLAEFSGKEIEKITDTATLMGDLELDSLDRVGTVMALEDEFRIEIGDDETREIETVGQAIAKVAQKLS